ncbi:MAG TPA: metalloregulator ArsR/SmtB family transcription factor [Dissulfurispiraceae bacterium]|nr:metalloregulator ArsR/SmtB family transcription factor [Dissulfurispiraceae bacterium]
MFMRGVLDIIKLLSDESRLRILLLLTEKELCVCQIMGVLNMSQPLISRNLSLLLKAGFLEDRREGKLMFYKIKKVLPGKHMQLLSVVQELLKDDKTLKKDLRSLQDCSEFQKQTGRCDMETLKAFMRYKKRKSAG